MRFVHSAILGLLVFIFVFSGVDKALHYEGFVNAVRNYVVVPPGAAPFLAPSLLLVELLVGFGLLVRRWRSSAALTAAGLLLLFTVAVALNAAFGDRGICGCWFTLTLAQGTGMHITQNLLLAGLALSLWAEPAPGADTARADGAAPVKEKTA